MAKTYPDGDAARRQRVPLARVQAAECASIESDPSLLLLEVEVTGVPRWNELQLCFDREDLLALATAILRTHRPTVSDEILAALQRIEERLPETG